MEMNYWSVHGKNSTKVGLSEEECVELDFLLKGGCLS